MREDLSPEAPAPTPLEQPALVETPSADGNADGHHREVTVQLQDCEGEVPSAPSAFAEEQNSESLPTAVDDWKAELRRDFERWLHSLDEIVEVSEAELKPTGTPDLYSFYEQLAAANVEARKANRRSAEAFSQWGETLVQFDGDLRLLREHLTRLPAARDDALPRAWCLALAEILDRALRLAGAFKTPPPKALFVRDARWRKAWAAQQQGLEILVSHLEELLKQAGVTRLSALHQPFDPATMGAVATEHHAQLPHHTVIEEVAPGYRLNGDLLRLAQVKVSINKL